MESLALPLQQQSNNREVGLDSLGPYKGRAVEEQWQRKSSGCDRAADADEQRA